MMGIWFGRAARHGARSRTTETGLRSRVGEVELTPGARSRSGREVSEHGREDVAARTIRSFVRPFASFVTVFAVVAMTSATDGYAARRGSRPFIPSESKKTGKNRYRSLLDWDKTLSAYRKVYGRDGNTAWFDIDAPARVKGVYIQNLRPGQSWEGINVYEADGKVQIFVVPADRASRKPDHAARTPKKTLRSERRIASQIANILPDYDAFFGVSSNWQDSGFWIRMSRFESLYPKQLNGPIV